MARGRKCSMNDTHPSYCGLGAVWDHLQQIFTRDWARLAQHCTQWIQKTFFFLLLELAVEARALSMPSKGLPLSYTPAWTMEFFLDKTVLRWALYKADSVKLTSRPFFYKVIVSLQASTRPVKNRQETQASMASTTDDNTVAPGIRRRLHTSMRKRRVYREASLWSQPVDGTQWALHLAVRKAPVTN